MFLFSSDPYFAEQFKRDLQISNIQANNVIDYEINATKIVAVYEADEINRYDSKDEAIVFKTTALRDRQIHSLSSDMAILQKDEVKFKGNARYENNDSVTFLSQEIIYDTKNKFLRSDVPFEMLRGADRVIGSSVVYDMNDKKMNAREIKAWVEQ